MTQLSILESYERQSLDLHISVSLANSACRAHAQNDNIICHLQVDEAHPTFNTIIYSLSQNYVGQVPAVRCRRYATNPLREFKHFDLADGDFVKCNANPFIVGDALFSSDLVLFLHNKTRKDPSCGPGQWYDITVEHHKAQIRTELLRAENSHFECDEQSLQRYAQACVPTLHYFKTLFNDIYDKVIKTANTEWNIAICRMGGGVVTIDWNAKNNFTALTAAQDCDTSKSQIDALGDFDARKLQRKVSVGIFNCQNKYNFSAVSALVPRKSESHTYAVPLIAEYAAQCFVLSEKPILGLNNKHDGHVSGCRLGPKTAYAVKHQYGSTINGYDIDELSKKFIDSSDGFHRVGRFLDKAAKLCDMKHPEFGLFLQDRSAISGQTDGPTRYVVVGADSLLIGELLEQFVFLFDDPERDERLQQYLHLRCKLRRTYNKEHRAEIIDKLRVGSSEYNECRRMIKIGFLYLPPAHLGYFVARIWGFNTTKEMLETKIVRNGQTILRGGEVQRIDVPMACFPPSIIETIAMDIGQTWVNSTVLTAHGFHSFGSFRGALKTLYQVFQGEVFHDARSRDGEALLNMENCAFAGHFAREVTNLPSCNQMFTNARPSNVVFAGEMGNEDENGIWKRYHMYGGKMTYGRALQRIHIVQNHYNRKRYEYYCRPENAEKLEQCSFSARLFADIDLIIKKEANLSDLMAEIQSKGAYVVENVSEKLKEMGLAMAQRFQLEFTSEEKFSDEMYGQLRQYLVDVADGSSMIDKEEHLERIKALFFQSFSDDFLERRVNHLAYYFI